MIIKPQPVAPARSWLLLVLVLVLVLLLVFTGTITSAYYLLFTTCYLFTICSPSRSPPRDLDIIVRQYLTGSWDLWIINSTMHQILRHPLNYLLVFINYEFCIHFNPINLAYISIQYILYSSNELCIHFRRTFLGRSPLAPLVASTVIMGGV